MKGKAAQKNLKVLGSIILLFILCNCSSPKNKGNHAVSSKSGVDNPSKVLIPLSALEAIGFEYITPSDFDLLFGNGSLFILNMRDRLVAKFEDDRPQSFYKGPKGQGPRDMLSPKSIFFYDSDTIAVHDYRRKCVLFFDLDLNYRHEIVLKNTYINISKTGMGLVAYFDEQDDAFAFLDDQFNIKDTFVKKNSKLPFDEFYYTWLNQGFFAEDLLVGHTFRKQPNKKCKLDFYNLVSRKNEITIKWEQPFSPSREDFLKDRDMYFTIFAAKMGQYYVVQNSTIKHFSKPGARVYEFLVFNDDGNIIYENEISHRLLRFQSEKDDLRLYILDETKGISYINLKDILK